MGRCETIRLWGVRGILFLPNGILVRIERNLVVICDRERECGDGTLDLVGVAGTERAQLHTQRRRHGLDRGQQASSGALFAVFFAPAFVISMRART
jgi:hypothetical protein